MELAKGKIQVYDPQLVLYVLGGLQRGELSPVLHGLATHRYQAPPELKFRDFWDAVLRGDVGEAARKYNEHHIFHLEEFRARYSQRGHGFSGVNMHHAALEKYWAAQLGMPMGTGGWQKCRAGGASVSEALQQKCRSLLIEAGLIKS